MAKDIKINFNYDPPKMTEKQEIAHKVVYKALDKYSENKSMFTPGIESHLIQFFAEFTECLIDEIKREVLNGKE